MSRLYVVLPFVISLLQRESRVTYQMLKDAFSLDDVLLAEVRGNMCFRQLAQDVDGRGLVWIGEAPARSQTLAAVAPNPSATAVATTVSSPATSAPAPLVITKAPPIQVPTSSPEVSPTGVLPGELMLPEPARSAPEAERRQLTVMFCDLVGSTDLSGKLDPEDLRQVVRAYQKTAAEVIQRYEGHIAQYLGDGLLIYFGFPVAHEDDAQRAVYTGLGIAEAMDTLNACLEAGYGVQLAVRIGIHTGPVVVGEMGGGGRYETLALGETPNIAARLEGLAQANQAVMSPVTAQLVQRSFVLEALGPYELKGVAEPMMLYTVVSPREIEPDDHEVMTTGGFDTLVGRDEEIGLLLRRWEQSKEGLGQVMLISGEAGIGKSSLVDGLRATVRQEGLTCIAFRCSPYHSNSVFYPILNYVQHTLGWKPDDEVDMKLSKLEQAFGYRHQAREDTVPLLAELLSLPLPETRYPLLKLSPQQKRQQTQDVLVAWLLDEAERQPVLLMWEDLHWADPSTLEALGLLIGQAPTAAMLNVLTFRPEFQPPWPARSHLTPIALNRLERPQVEALISDLAGGKTLPAEVVQHIVAKTDGVPLYIEELTKMLLASGLLRDDAGAYVLTGPLVSLAIPDTLQDSLRARLDQMHTAKEAAQLGAVLGREFPYEMLRAICSQDEATLQAGLAQLVEAELLFQRGRPPQARYIFKHALIQEAAYASLLKSTQQRVHRQIVELLEARFPEVAGTQPELVAYHGTEAGQDEVAITYWQRAGQRALEHSAHAEAIAHLTQGLALLTKLPDTPARQHQELDLQVTFGSALMNTQGQGALDVERAYGRAWELCQQIGDTPQVFPVLRGLIAHYLVGGQLQMATQFGDQLLQLAHAQPDPARLLFAHFQLGQMLFLKGEPTSSQTHHRQALAIYSPQEHGALTVRYGVDLGVSSHSRLAWELWQLGYPDQALEQSQAACTLAQEVSHPYSLATALFSAAALHQFRREPQAAHEQAEALRRLATEQGYAHRLALGTVLRGWAWAMQGQVETGIAEIRQGIAAALATGDQLFHLYFLGLLAEAYEKGGHPDEGLFHLAEAISVMDTTEARYYGSELYRLKGALLLRQVAPDFSQAEDCFHEALDLSRRQQANPDNS
ncbi:adenylate/guanylate cyclase domain-containing protein [Candidatus Entotheonella palauensis]|uniref:adenylate/guanylate cyclase domain-containing protein n=1 Tax=Candidatus Entotheonella palauensis TaxID=93172 RepID=UPI002117325F|nr:adenylate/guanylate cyclase domain-containing protein [Candidatus Entotheonella palauensis]